MIKKRALITVVSEITIGDSDVIEVTTPGEFIVNDGQYLAVYEETELSGMGGTTTSMEITESEVELRRVGTTESCMKFENNNVDVSLYKTPYGALEVTVNTNKLNINIDENGGEIQIEYDMVVGDQPPYSTKLSVKIETK